MDSEGLPTFGRSGYNLFVLRFAEIPWVLKAKETVRIPSDLKEVVERVYTDEDPVSDIEISLTSRLNELRERYLKELEKLESEAGVEESTRHPSAETS